MWLGRGQPLPLESTLASQIKPLKEMKYSHLARQNFHKSLLRKKRKRAGPGGNLSYWREREGRGLEGGDRREGSRGQ